VFKEAEAGRKEGKLTEGQGVLGNHGSFFGTCRNKEPRLRGYARITETSFRRIIDRLGGKVYAVEQEP
jgi:hypothetical protein